MTQEKTNLVNKLIEVVGIINMTLWTDRQRYANSSAVMKKLKNYVAIDAIVGNIPPSVRNKTCCVTAGIMPSIVSKMEGYKIHINHILVMADYWANDAIRYGFSKLGLWGSKSL